MSRRFASTGSIPTWEALKETSELSGDDDSGVEEEEEDQIRATPAPTMLGSLSHRPSYKRKESDWKSESVSKRARHEQAGASVNLSVQGSQPATIQRASSLRVAMHANTGVLSVQDDSSMNTSVRPRPLPSTSALPLPSRVRKMDLRQYLLKDNQPPSTGQPAYSQPSHKTDSHPIATSSTVSTTQTKPSDSKHTPEKRLSLGNNIPSIIDSTLLSEIFSKRAADADVSKQKTAPTEVIEISDDDDAPKGKEKVPNSTPPPNPAGRSTVYSSTKPTSEVIEIFDSEEESTPRGVRPLAGKPSECIDHPPPISPTRRGFLPSPLTSRLASKNDAVSVRSMSKTRATSSHSNPDHEAMRSDGNSSMFINAGHLMTAPLTTTSVVQEKIPGIAATRLSSGSPSSTLKKQDWHGFSTLSAPPITTPPSSPNQSRPVSKVHSTGPVPMRARMVAKPPSSTHSRTNSDAASQSSMKGKAKESAPLQAGSGKQRWEPAHASTKSDPVAQRPPQGPGNSLASAIDLTADVSDGEEPVANIQALNEKVSSSPQVSAMVIPPVVPICQSALSQKEKDYPKPPSSSAGPPASDSHLEIENLPHLPSKSPSLQISDTSERDESPDVLASELRSEVQSRMASNGPEAVSLPDGSESPSSPDINSPFQTPATDLVSPGPNVADSDVSHAAIAKLPTVRPRSTSSQEIVDALANYGLESDEGAMQEADEFPAPIEDLKSMEEETFMNDDGMGVASDVEHPSQSLIPRMSLRTSPDSGDASSEPPQSLSSPVSVPSTRRSSRLSSYSNSEDQRLTFYEDRSAFPSGPTSRSTTPDHIATVAVHSRTLGGFPAFCFESYRADPRNFPKVHYASELPSAIQDHMNHLPEEVRKLGDLREVYQAMILENTADDERDAPPITIQNFVDYEPTPPWEFWYSNKMWHGKGVPDPDLKFLKGCDCRGACNPKSKTCACAIQHQQYLGEKAADFAYDKNGKLKYPGYPIFECNNKCWCGPECTNRVVQCGRKVQISIQKTVNKGWGVFNGPKKFTQGTFIGIYAGELLTDTEAHARGLNYNKAGMTYLFDLDFHHLRDGKSDEEWTTLYTVDAYHAGNFTRFLNHSCNPNCRLYPCYINEGNIQKPLLAVFSIRDIEPNEEICFNYQGKYPGDEDDDDAQEEEIDMDIPKDKIYQKCECGSDNCRGAMFN